VSLLAESLNVFDQPLSSCGKDPLTGFFRDGCCNTSDSDAASHTICVEVSGAFLDYSRSIGNDLMTPRPEFGFVGLKPGDRWCVCALRWLEACENQVAPRVFLESTHKRALELVPLQLLQRHTADLS
jgi:uncharacterized protein (DUF2237 family)